MDGLGQTGAIIAAMLTFAGALLAYFKFKPGQKEVMEVSVAQATMNIAQGTFQLVTTELEDQFRRMSTELREQSQVTEGLRQAFGVMRADLTTAERRLDTITGERDDLLGANVTLRRRVASLETEVSQLRAELKQARG